MQANCSNRLQLRNWDERVKQHSHEIEGHAIHHDILKFRRNTDHTSLIGINQNLKKIKIVEMNAKDYLKEII